MKFIVALALLTTSAVAVQLQYDTAYDHADQSLSSVACSNGENGLLTKGYTTFGSVKGTTASTYVGAAEAITGWNSAACGNCYQIKWSGSDRTIN
ncbi:hypothetical protein MPER_00128, partial [Moniliophthora perniciosa FA553]